MNLFNDTQMIIMNVLIVPGDAGEEMGTKGCLKMKEGEPLKEEYGYKFL